MVLIPKEEESEKEKEEEASNELNFTSEIVPEIFYEKGIEKEDGSYSDHKIFKFNAKKEESNEKKKKNEIPYIIEYTIGNDIYTITFNVKGNTFIYDIDLQKGDYYINNIVKLNIEQNIIPPYNKIEIFLEALEKNNQTNKIEKLYEEAIELYKYKKKFNLLIFLFLRIYEQENLCSKLFSKLLATFSEIKGIENPIVDTNLARDLDTFNQIFSNEEFLEKGKYDPISFYGIILCYFYYYDKNNNYFSKSINKLYKENKQCVVSLPNKEGKKEPVQYKVLYEILIMFHSYFLKPLNQDYYPF